MTDRIKALVVTLGDDYRRDDGEEISNAIRMIRGVQSVEMVKTDIDDYVNRERVRVELVEKLLEVLQPKKG